MIFLRTLVLELNGRGYPADADISQPGNPRFHSATKQDEHCAAMVAAFRARLTELMHTDPALVALLSSYGVTEVELADLYSPGAAHHRGAVTIQLGANDEPSA